MGADVLRMKICAKFEPCASYEVCAEKPPLRQAAKRCGEIALRDSFATTWRQPSLPVAQSLPTVDFAQLAVWQNHSARKLRLRSVTSPSCRHVMGYATQHFT